MMAGFHGGPVGHPSMKPRALAGQPRPARQASPVRGASPATHGSMRGNLTLEGALVLDQTVERNKNLKDAHIVENWIRKSHEILERHELDPLPDSFLQTVPSETGTDNSAAMTSEHLHYDQQPTMKAQDQISPPESPPWRLMNEGGVPGEVPRLALHEIQQALAACQEQAREEAFQRGKRQEHEQKTKESSHRAGREGHREKQHKPELPPKKEASGKATVQASQENLQSGDAREMSRDNRGSKQITLGLSLGDSDKEGMKVVRIKDAGCVAMHGGIQIGDHILEIDGVDVSDKNAIELNKLVCGPRGSQAVLKVSVSMTALNKCISVKEGRK